MVTDQMLLFRSTTFTKKNINSFHVDR